MERLIDRSGLRLALRVALWLAGTGVAFYLLKHWLATTMYGALVAVMLSPFIAAAVVWPLMNLVSDTVRQARASALAPLEGRYYAFRGQRVSVIEDATGQRWTRAEDLRRILRTGTADSALAHTYGEGFALLGAPPQGYLNETALLEHLARQPSPDARRMHAWALRDVVAPARLKRGER